MSPNDKKRQADLQIIAEWVKPGERVLDLGCGRGVLLDYLKQKKSIYGVGVDIDVEKIISCVKRGVPVYQGDIAAVLATFPDDAFDHVIFSRTVEHLENPGEVLAEGLRVGKRVTVGFVNRSFWINRLNFLLKGRQTINEVFPRPWYASMPSNPFSVVEFEDFCESRRIVIENKVFLAGNWRSQCRRIPNFMAGYAIYDLSSVD